MWKLVSTIVLMNTMQLSHSAFLRCYEGSLDNFIMTPLNKPPSVSNSSCIDQSLPTVIYTFGYRGRVEGPATTAVLTAYLATKKRNVILLDWEEEAKSGLLGIPLGYMLYAVPNAKKVGEELGEAIVKMARAGLNMTHVHLLGHSLGAHIMGHAGRHARKEGYVVSRITGLDPARALFEGSFAVQRGLERTCARFVDVVHSDAGGYGGAAAAGSVDVWPNAGAAQPGCPAGDFDMFSPEDLCSHDRAWRYFVEAIASPTAFPASAAADYDSWAAAGGRSNQTIYMGDLTSTRARGNYYLSTNSVFPFGKGTAGLKPGDTQDRRRRNSALTRLLKYLR